jgi:tight adherence protein C
MLQILTWFLSLTCLVAGLAVLSENIRQQLVTQDMMQRFRIYVAPTRFVPWLGSRACHTLERFGRRIAGAGQIHDLQDQLLRAGFLNPAAPFVFISLRLGLALFTAALLIVPTYIHHGTITGKTASLTFVSSFLVYRAASLFLKLRTGRRQREIRRELPYVLDLLLMVLESGVSVDQALHHVSGQIGKVAPISSSILMRYVADTEEGMPYDKALDRLAQRLAVSEGRDFAGLLKQNLFQGGELSQPLHRLAADVGETRLAHAREQLGRKSVQLTIVMLAFFMPVLFIALAGPAVSELTGTLSRVAHDMNHMRAKR